jgi:hypothetical protein
MGNRIAADLVDAIRNSTLGTTLCSRSETMPPEFVDIRQFPGVAKALVYFLGDKTKIVGAPCIIERSYNIDSVTYQGLGRYKITFKTGTFKDNRYVISGSTIQNISNLSAANMFYTVSNPDNAMHVTLSSFVLTTLHTSTSGVSAADAEKVGLLFH